MKYLLLATVLLSGACAWTNTNVPDKDGKVKGSLMSRSTINGKPINRPNIAAEQKETITVQACDANGCHEGQWNPQ